GPGAGQDESSKGAGSVIVPAWARVAVLAGLFALVAYSVLLAPAIARMPLGSRLPGWAALAIATLPPATFASLLLGLLWMLSRRLERRGRMRLDTERRFRSAVEAARCGVWEWDLEQDRVYVSDRLAAMLGWPESGVFDGDELLERVDPDHRERVLKALR